MVDISFELSLEEQKFFFFKQKTAYELRISDWSSDVCSSDLLTLRQLLKMASDHGLQTVHPVGLPFNPEQHQAMSTIRTFSSPPKRSRSACRSFGGVSDRKSVV